MRHEDYVTFEVAKLLKEKGYNEYCNANYFIKDDSCFNYKEGEMCIGSHTIDGECITVPAPTLWDAQKWLREDRNIWVYVYPEYKQVVEYRIRVTTFDDLIENGKRNGKVLPLWFEKYEQALNEGIKEALKLI